MKLALTILFSVLVTTASAQYAPQAGLTGSTAVAAGSSELAGWATNCTVQRGFIDIANPPLGNVSTGTDASATGPANGSIVCLGDSGIATLTFAAGIYNGPGPDFAVFENGFKNAADPAMAFLELAFVEVSSDGINYFRFPANSNTPTNTQVPGSGVYMDASLINNLAGKYISMYGTPFDLQELAGQTGLDINNVTHVRLIDVVGAVTAHSSLDQTGNVINDPYPTNFPTGGFDLDAVAAMHLLSTGITTTEFKISANVYPNPAADYVTLSVNGNIADGTIVSLSSVTGKKMLEIPVTGHNISLPLTAVPAGMYYLSISDTNGSQWTEKIIKY